MAVRPNTDGYLSRTTNVPVNATNWTWCARFMAVSAPVNPSYPSLFNLNVDNDNWLNIDIPPATLNLELERQAPSVSFAYANSSIFTLTAGAWYFLAAKCTGTGTLDILHGPFGAETLTKIAGLSIPNASWTQVWHLSDNFDGDFTVGRSLAVKMWHAALSDAEILAESKSAPPVRTANLDSYLSLIDATDAGDDESGNNRDWTVTGTLATEPYVAAGPIGPAAATAAAPALSVAATQPVTQGLASATAAAPSLSVQAVQPVTPSRANATASAPALSAQATQPVSLGVASVQASALPMVVDAGGVLLGVASVVVSAFPLTVSVPSLRRRAFTGRTRGSVRRGVR